ncbi:MAG: S8 family peptidase [Muribaculaceae bacterium]
MILAMCLSSTSLYAFNGKVSPRTRYVLSQTDTKAEVMKPCFIKITDESVIAELEKLGVKISCRFNDILTAQIPLSQFDEVSKLAQVKYMQLAQQMSVCNYNARRLSSVDEVHSAKGINRSYTGKGVIVGMVDVGIDFNSVEFSDKQGNSRVKGVYLPSVAGGATAVIDGKELPGTSYTTPEAIAALTTDCTTMSHGTHTTTTAAGGYSGNDYYGVATESDLVLCAMPEEELTDVNIANSIAYIFDYADKAGKPAVINMSLSSNCGPHDGTSMLSQAMAAATGKGRLCVLSVGNDAKLLTKVSKTFLAQTDTLRTFFENLYARYSVYGDLDMWSDSSKPFKAQFVVYDKRKRGVVFKSKWYEASSNVADVTVLKADEDEFLKDIYTGEVCFTSGIGNNGCMELYTTFDIKAVCDAEEAGNYYMGMRFYADTGSTITGWSNTGTGMVSNGIDGWVYGTPDGNISDLVTGEGVVSVGAYCSCNSVNTYGGTVDYNGSELGDIAFFSSYGKDMNGVSRPTVTAPGYVVVSCMNRFDSGSTATTDKSLLEDIDGSTYSWGTMYGTSQSAPVVTGTIALWLEANGQLTPDEVMHLLEESSTRDDFVINGNPDKWGYGKLNALKGLHLIEDSSIGNVAETSRLWNFVANDGSFTIFAPCDGNAKLMLFDVSGGLVLTSQCEVEGGIGVVRCAEMPESGVYVARVEIGSAVRSFKVIIQ